MAICLSSGQSVLSSRAHRFLKTDALHSYQEALPLFQQLKDSDDEGKTLMSIGLVQVDLSQDADALQSEQQAVALSRLLASGPLTTPADAHRGKFGAKLPSGPLSRGHGAKWLLTSGHT